MVNYPGSTVDYLTGRALKKYEVTAQITDTPGIYSLSAKTPSEKIANSILYETPSKTVVVTIDILRLSRQLPLALQLKSAGFNVVIALTMTDLVSNEQKEKIKQLSDEINLPVFPIEGLLGKGVKELLKGVKEIAAAKDLQPAKKEIKKPGPWLVELQNEFFKKTDQAVLKLFPDPKKTAQLKTNYTFDRFLLHPFFGVVSFTAIMFGLFSSIFWLAAPLMDLVDVGFSFLADKIQSGQDSLWKDFLSNGVVTSFAAVFVFVPQIFILFAGICILEDSGYLARAASLMDALFSKVGLSGRSFVPFLSGYACAIPACMAARNITSRAERLIVLAVIPLLTCSARLPVYSLLLSLFFYGDSAWKAGFWMAVVYIASMILAGLSAYVLNKFVRKSEKPPFVMELPLYKRPLFLNVLFYSWKRTKQYIKGAGPLIFMFALLIWGASHFPRDLNLSESEQIENSYAGRFGKQIEPVFEWMGGDWRVGVSLLAAFTAREVFVSTLAALFQITQTESESTIKHSLLKKMKSAENKRGDPVFTPLSQVVLILFFMISLQCLSTTAIVRKEAGSSIFALAQLAILNILAYVLCVLVYQAGVFAGFG